MLGIDKFDLQQRLVNSFLKRIKEQNWSELSDLESLDLVNSCYILVSAPGEGMPYSMCSG